MRKLFTLMCCSALMCLSSINAQSIKGDFNSPWVSDVKGNGALPGQFLRPGTQPLGWEASNVNQKVLLEKKEIVVTSDVNRTGGEGFSVKMENKFVGVMTIGSNAPAYITLGTPWVYAIMDIPSCDGGTLGGVSYTERPDSLVGYYKRTIGAEGEEPALLMAYLWKGSTTSTVNINPSGGLTANETTQVQDQDLCILGKKTPDSGNAVLVGKAEYNINGALNEWTRIAIPVEYNGNTDAPEKMNIVLSSSNYWSRNDIKAGNILWADDVHLVSNAKLRSVTLDGNLLTGFDDSVYEYQLPYSDRNKVLVASAWGDPSNTTVSVVASEEAGVSLTKTITVTSTNTTGKSTYVYKVVFKGGETTINLPENAPSFTYGAVITDLGFTSNSSVAYTYSSSNESVIALENGTLRIVGVGTAEITAIQKGNESNAPAKSAPLTVTVNPAVLKVTLADGAWVERGLDVSATNKTNGKCFYDFVYEGLQYGETAENAVTTAVTITSKADKTAEVVGNKRAATLSGGAAKNYTFEYGTESQFTIAKTTLDVYVYYNTLPFNSGYDDEKYHKIGTPVGIAPKEFVLSYFNMKYNEKIEDILGANLPTVLCGITEDALVGSEHPVTLQLPTVELDNYKLNSKVPSDAVLVVKKVAVFKYAPIEAKEYGDAKFSIGATVDQEEGENPVTVQYKSLTTAVASISLSTGEVTIKKAGNTQIVLTTPDSKIYPFTTDTINLAIAKAPLTVTAQNAVRKEGEENPEFILAYDGFKNGENETTKNLFTTVPSIVCDADVNSSAGTYDIKVVGGEAANYNIIPVNGTLIVEEGLGVTDNKANAINVYSNNGAIYINGNLSGENIFMYNAQGILIGEYSGADATVEGVDKGALYIVKVGRAAYKVLAK